MAKNVKFDLKDRKILHELDWNARLSNTEIGKRVGLSKKGVEYRIKKLERIGVIQGYYPVIDYLKLGYSTKRIMIKFKHINSETKKKIDDYVFNNKNFGWVVNFIGEYDIGFATRTKDSVMFLKEIKKFLIKFGKYIDTRVFEETIGMREYPLKFLLDKKSTNKLLLDNLNYKTYNLNKNEDKIIKSLIKNARLSLTEIGKQVNLSNSVVSKRMKSLYSNGVLIATRAKIDTKLLGKEAYKVFLDVDVDGHSYIEKIEDYIEQQIETAYIVDLVGKSDIDFEAYFSSHAEFLEFMEKLQNKFSDVIEKYSYMVFNKTLKIEYIPS